MTYLSGNKFSSFSIFLFSEINKFPWKKYQNKSDSLLHIDNSFSTAQYLSFKINYVSTLYNTFCICTKINFILFEITSRSTLRFLINHVLRFYILCKLLKVNTSIVFLVLCHQRKNDGYFVILEVLQKAYHEHAWASRKLYSFLGKNIHWFKGDQIYKIFEYFIWLSRYVSFQIDLVFYDHQFIFQIKNKYKSVINQLYYVLQCIAVRGTLL